MRDTRNYDRHGVVALLILLFAITYLDRVCISVAGPRMQEELGISPAGWGWVTGMFTLAYGLFEIPTGVMGDRLGPRRVLTRIVTWWSAFTALTGMVTNYYWLLVVRFCFGAGEAGAFPNSSVVVSRWFPKSQHATMSGVTLMASQIGGGLAPLLVVPIQMRWGWRASFFVFGALGVIWSVVWYAWFRDYPEEKRGVAHVAEGTGAGGEAGAGGHGGGFPWRAALTNSSVLAAMAMVFTYAYGFNFFQTWLHTFLVKGRGMGEGSLYWSALPYAMAACSNLAGGFVSDALVKRWGPKVGRRAVSMTSLFAAGLFTLAAMASRDGLTALMFLGLVYGAITFQMGGVFGLCLDIGQRHAGAMVGMMNTAAQAGGLTGSVAFGYIVQATGSYDAPFVPMAAMLLTGALLWVKIDASRPLEG